MALPPEFECPICLKLLFKPVTTSCGHNFCKYCIDKTVMVSENCPMCRLPLSSEYSPNLLLTQIINERFPEEIEERSQHLAKLDQDNKMELNVELEEDYDYLPLYFRNYYNPPIFVDEIVHLSINTNNEFLAVQYAMANGSRMIIANRIFNKIRPVGTLVEITSKPLSPNTNINRVPITIEGIAVRRVELMLPPVKTTFDFYLCGFKVFDDFWESYNIQAELISTYTSERECEIRNKINNMIDRLPILTSNPRSFFHELIQLKSTSRLFGGHNKYLFCILLINGCLSLIKKKLNKSPTSLKSRFRNLYGDLPMPIDQTAGVEEIVKLSLYLSRITLTTNGTKWVSYSSHDTLERLYKVIELITLSWESNFINLGEPKLLLSLFSSMDQLTSGILFLIAIVLIPKLYLKFMR